jgi:catechol 2,3-dioxygenase-like lactoylglutathione lyase family enzyme
MIKGINHIAISTGDIDRLSRFYRDVLGFELMSERAFKESPRTDSIIGLKNSAARVMYMKCGNLYLELFEFSAPAVTRADPGPLRPNDHGYTHFCLEVEDIDAEYQRMSRAGMNFNAPVPPIGPMKNRAAYGHDPDGNIIEIVEFLSDDSGRKIEDLRRA